MKYNINFTISPKKNPYKGRYIALEGIDGSGKSTQSQLLQEYFKKNGQTATIVHFPRKETGLFSEINRAILKGQEKIPKEAFQYLFSADYSMLVEEEISPRLKKGELVITDRFHCYSSVAYGLIDANKAVDTRYAQSLMVASGLLSTHFQFYIPDVTFYLKINTATAMERISVKSDKDIYEKKEILVKISKGYDLLRKEFPEVFTDIDAERSIDVITKNMVQILSKYSKKI